VNNISFQYPTWFIIFCLALGLVYAASLYYKDKTFKDQSSRLNLILGSIRWLTATIIAMLLLSPVIKMLITDVKKPIIAIGLDNSESMRWDLKDSIKLLKTIDELQPKLGEKFEVKYHTFGDKILDGKSLQFTDKQTNIAGYISEMYNQYDGQNLAGLILVTDGIYNEGNNPIYIENTQKVPIYSIALGDTTPQKDVAIKNVFNNNIVYLNDKFNAQIDLSAYNCVGSNITLSVQKIDNENVQNISTQNFNVSKVDFFQTKEITLDAKQAGVQHYRITATKLNGERNVSNNTKDFYIEVLDSRQKVLILANSPHPDVSALKEAITNNKNYTVTVSYIDEMKSNIADYNFVIFHQLPSKNKPIDGLLNILNTKKTSRLFIVGSQTNTRQLTQQQNAVIFNTDNTSSNEIQAIVNSNFNYFTVDENVKKNIPQFNAISAPFGDMKEVNGAQTILYQKIGKVDTKYPLLTFTEYNGIKQGVLAAEGIWKWRLFDYVQHQNFETIDDLISKSIQYLSVKEDKRKFKVSTGKNIYSDNEDILFNGELYNNSYELVNEPDVKMTITNDKGKTFNYTFNKNDRIYTLNVNQYPEGNYTFKAETNYAGQPLNSVGQFSVQPTQLELYETTANHALLRSLANKNGGKVVGLNQTEDLINSIKNDVNIKPLMYQTNKTESAINLKWIFGLLILLLAAEWFIRKYFGAY
jgi:hypothetical protein